MRRLDVKIEHVDPVASADAVDQIADCTGVKENLGDSRPDALAENGFALPDEKTERRDGENRQRPNLPLEHSPGAAPVLHVRKIEKAGDDGDRGLRLQKSRRQLFDDGVGENEIGDGRKRYQHELHLPLRSISLWHSMHVSTKGWFMSRGLRISWPHDVQTP